MGPILGGFILLAGVVMLIAGAKGSGASLLPSIFGTSSSSSSKPSTSSTVDEALASLSGVGGTVASGATSVGGKRSGRAS